MERPTPGFSRSLTAKEDASDDRHKEPAEEKQKKETKKTRLDYD